MQVLKNVCRTVVALFLIASTPFGLYSDHVQQNFGELKNNNEFVMKNEAINQNNSNESDKPRIQLFKKHKKLSYYLFIEDFAKSFIEIPTSNVSVDSSTISSSYLAGRAVVYNEKDEKVGTCSASFLCMQNAEGIFTDISNYLSIDNGLIVTWFTPTTLINLELDSIIHSMVTECIVTATTKVGFNPFYGKTFNMIVSSDDKKIYFKLSKI